jgi:hypothetical protein
MRILSAGAAAGETVAAACPRRRPIGVPLLLYCGRRGVTAAAPADRRPEVADALLAWPRHADWI